MLGASPHAWPNRAQNWRPHRHRRRLRHPIVGSQSFTLGHTFGSAMPFTTRSTSFQMSLGNTVRPSRECLHLDIGHDVTTREEGPRDLSSHDRCRSYTKRSLSILRCDIGTRHTIHEFRLQAPSVASGIRRFVGSWLSETI
jgi:hypothetical protein